MVDNDSNALLTAKHLSEARYVRLECLKLVVMHGSERTKGDPIEKADAWFRWVMDWGKPGRPPKKR